MNLSWLLIFLFLFTACGGGEFVVPTYPIATPRNPVFPVNSPDANPSANPEAPSPQSDPFMDEVVQFLNGPNAGFGMGDFPDIVLGGPRGNGALQGSSDVLSLGVGGSITLKSEIPILNGEGVDFIVFENPFWVGGDPEKPFAELGEVSVSQDGRIFQKFPCEEDLSLELFPGCAGVEPVFANVETNNLDPTDPGEAGGDPFDLADLDLDWIQYIKIRDLSDSGSGNSAGFDLDAIAIVHQ